MKVKVALLIVSLSLFLGVLSGCVSTKGKEVSIDESGVIVEEGTQ